MDKLQKVQEALEQAIYTFRKYEEHHKAKGTEVGLIKVGQNGLIAASQEEALAALKEFREGDKGEVSDGHHTFNELYEHRHALFSALIKRLPLHGWKSKLHDDGSMFKGWFIAGFATPHGTITYHIPRHLWHEFPCKELDKAPKWDGHTSEDVIERLYSVRVEKPKQQST